MRKRANVLLDDVERGSGALDTLRRAGFDAVRSESVRHLGRTLDETSPDLLVLEGPFGDLSGTAVLEQLRRAGVVLPAVLYCGSEVEVRAARGLPGLRPYLPTSRLDAAALDRAVGSLMPMEAQRVPLAPRGGLGEGKLRELLLGVLRNGWTGRLQLESGGTEKTIYFDRGLPVYCSSNILSENFGQMLLRKGVITEIEYEWARKMQLREGIRQGEALVKIGVLNHRDLFGHLRDQIEEKIVNAFGWHDGTYELVEDSGFLDQVTRFALNPISIGIAGTRRFASPTTAQEVWIGLRHRWAITACDVAEIASSARQALSPAVLEALNSPQLAADLALEQGWDRLKASAVFSTLEAAGFVLLSNDPDSLPQAHGLDLEVEDPQGRTGVYKALGETREHQVVSDERSEDERRLSESLWKAYLRMSCADYFSVLGVNQIAGPTEVVAARDELLDVYSDHRFRAVLDRPQNARALEELQHKIQLAAETLLNEERRHAYSKSLGDTDEEPRRQVLSAEDEFQEGMEELEADRQEQAREHFGRAMALHPTEPLYMLYSGWARYLSGRSEDDKEHGKRLMTKAVAANPVLDEGYVLLARVYQLEGNAGEAREQASTALVFNPENEAAAELMRVLGE